MLSPVVGDPNFWGNLYTGLPEEYATVFPSVNTIDEIVSHLDTLIENRPEGQPACVSTLIIGGHGTLPIGAQLGEDFFNLKHLSERQLEDLQDQNMQERRIAIEFLQR